MVGHPARCSSCHCSAALWILSAVCSASRSASFPLRTRRLNEAATPTSTMADRATTSSSGVTPRRRLLLRLMRQTVVVAARGNCMCGLDSKPRATGTRPGIPPNVDVPHQWVRQIDKTVQSRPRRTDRLSQRVARCFPSMAFGRCRHLSRGAERPKSVRLVNEHTCPRVFSAVLVVGFAAYACSGAKTKSVGPDTWRVECANSMATCAARADDLCGDRGYVILGGQSQKEIHGPEGQQIAQERGELVVQCGQRATGPTPAAGQAGSWRLNPPAHRAAQEPAAPPSPRPSPGKLCTPGETQMCVGPGACRGGQACMTDGSGFLPCDCGAGQTAPDAAGPLPEPSDEATRTLPAGDDPR